jgi:hypothetical protein
LTKKEKKTYRKYSALEDSLNYDFSYNDEETIALHQRVNSNSKIDINDLRRISLWKIDRVLGVNDETIDKLRLLVGSIDISISDGLVKEIIDDLVNFQGIGFPMASSLSGLGPGRLDSKGALCDRTVSAPLRIGDYAGAA